jgi:hypothetical protein
MLRFLFSQAGPFSWTRFVEYQLRPNHHYFSSLVVSLSASVSASLSVLTFQKIHRHSPFLARAFSKCPKNILILE